MFFSQKLAMSYPCSETYHRPDETMQWIQDRIGAVDEGRALLDLAKKNNINITFSQQLDDDENGVTYGEFDPVQKEIRLNRFTDKKVQVFILAHELTHLRQHFEMKLDEIDDENDNYKTKDMIMMQRLMEGDANANAAMIVRKINQTEKRALPYPYYSKLGFGLRAVFRQLAGRKSTDAYLRQRLFVNFQKHSDARFYDRTLCNDMEPDTAQSKNITSAEFSGIVTTIKGGDMQNFSYFGAQNVEQFFEKMQPFVPAKYRRG